MKTKDLLRQARISKKLTLRGLVEQIDKSFVYIHNLEKGNKLLSLKSSKLFAENLCIDHERLIQSILQDKLDAHGLNYTVSVK